MNEQVLPYDHGRVPFGQDTRVGTAGSERRSPGTTFRRQGHDQGIGHINLYQVLEIPEALLGDVPQVKRDVHQFMVSIQDMDRTTGLFSLGDQAGKEFGYLRFIPSPIKLIAGLYDHEPAADPVILFIDGAGEAKRPAGRIQVAMQIADRNDPFNGRESGGYLAGVF